MLILLIVGIAGAVGLGHVVHIYYDIKHDQERKRLNAHAAQDRATRKYYIG